MTNPTLKYDPNTSMNLGQDNKEPVINAEELRKTNCQVILQQTQKELRTLLFRASKLVTTENMHIQLEKSEKFDIIEGTNEFIKIAIKYRKPPVVLSFEYA